MITKNLLTGFPLKQYKIYRTDSGKKEELWVSNDLLSTYLHSDCHTYELTEESRMSYAPPQWLPREENEQGCLLLLDDFSRASPMFLQAVMELINEGKYLTWSLPKNTTIALSSNPESGDYNVSCLDNAQKTRFVNFNLEFDIKAWAEWAENAGIDGRAINFCLAYPEIFEKKDSVQTINARSFVTFANAISGLPDWSDSKSLAMILNIAKGCFTDKDNLVGHLFTTFIANKLDKLVSPEDMLLGKWETTKQHVKDCVYDDNGHYRPDVAAVLHTRLLNYCLYYFKQPKASTQVVQDRLLEFIEASEDKDTMLFSEDFIFDIIRVLMKYHPDRTNKFMLNKKIREKVK